MKNLQFLFVASKHLLTKTLDQDEPKIIVDVIVEISKAFHEKLTAQVQIILIGFFTTSLG